jgi:hypothetical protein
MFAREREWGEVDFKVKGVEGKVGPQVRMSEGMLHDRDVSGIWEWAVGVVCNCFF